MAPRRKTLKHVRVTDVLRQQISTGFYRPGVRLPTGDELPRILKVGKQTVVRALNELVREGLVVRRRGDGSYVSEVNAPPLIRGSQLRIGILWPRAVSAAALFQKWWGEMTQGVLEAWNMQQSASRWYPAEHGNEPARATWHSTARGLTLEALGECTDGEQRHPDLAAVREGRFDGLLALNVIEESWLEEVAALGIPMVLVDFPSDRFLGRVDQVYLDPLSSYRAAVRHFAKRGLRRIHFVGTLVDVSAPSPGMTFEAVQRFREGKQRADPDSFLRLSAFRQAMDECDLPVVEGQVHFAFDGAGQSLAEALLSPSEAERAEAVVCHSYDMANRLIAEFSKRGLALAGAGARNQEPHGPALPIRADGRELGRAAAELLLWRLQRADRTPARLGVPMTFVGAGEAREIETQGNRVETK